MVFWRNFTLHGIPLILAVAAALALLPWIMGASAVQGDAASRGYGVGLAALFLYPSSYQVLIIAWAICRWKRWSLARVFLQLIWCCLGLFAAAMAYSLVLLADYFS